MLVRKGRGKSLEVGWKTALRGLKVLWRGYLPAAGLTWAKIDEDTKQALALNEQKESETKRTAPPLFSQIEMKRLFSSVSPQIAAKEDPKHLIQRLVWDSVPLIAQTLGHCTKEELEVIKDILVNCKESIGRNTDCDDIDILLNEEDPSDKAEAVAENNADYSECSDMNWSMENVLNDEQMEMMLELKKAIEDTLRNVWAKTAILNGNGDALKTDSGKGMKSKEKDALTTRDRKLFANMKKDLWDLFLMKYNDGNKDPDVQMGNTHPVHVAQPVIPNDALMQLALRRQQQALPPDPAQAAQLVADEKRLDFQLNRLINNSSGAAAAPKLIKLRLDNLVLNGQGMWRKEQVDQARDMLQEVCCSMEGYSARAYKAKVLEIVAHDQETWTGAKIELIATLIKNPKVTRLELDKLQKKILHETALQFDARTVTKEHRSVVTQGAAAGGEHDYFFASDVKYGTLRATLFEMLLPSARVGKQRYNAALLAQMEIVKQSTPSMAPKDNQMAALAGR